MDENVRVRDRYLTTYDYHQCVELLRREEMNNWISSEASNLLYVISHRLFGKVDLATAFTTRLIDNAANVDRLTILRYFCKQQNIVSTALALVKTLIFHALDRHRKRFSAKSRQFTLLRFQTAADQLEELWALFLDVLGAAKIEYFWIMIDNIDILLAEPSSEVSEDTLALLNGLDELADDKNIIVKILITARHGGASNSLSASLTECKILSSRHAILTIPRGRHRPAASLWAMRSKKPHRLSDLTVSTRNESFSDPISPEAILFEPWRRISSVEDANGPRAKALPRTKQNSDSDCSDTVATVGCADSTREGVVKHTLHCPKTKFTLGDGDDDPYSGSSSDLVFGENDGSESTGDGTVQISVRIKSTAGDSEDSGQSEAERRVDDEPSSDSDNRF